MIPKYNFFLRTQLKIDTFRHELRGKTDKQEADIITLVAKFLFHVWYSFHVTHVCACLGTHLASFAMVECR